MTGVQTCALPISDEMLGQKCFLVLLRHNVGSKVLFSASQPKCWVKGAFCRNDGSKVLFSASQTKCWVKSAFQCFSDIMFG